MAVTARSVRASASIPARPSNPRDVDAALEIVRGGAASDADTLAKLDAKKPDKAEAETISGDWNHTGALTRLGRRVQAPVTTVAALTALTKATLADGEQFYVGGYATVGYGGGWFRWDSSSTATVIAGFVLAADEGGAGRFIRVTDYASPMMAGAAGDGVTDDATARDAAYAYAKAYSVELVIDRPYAVSTNLNVESGVTIRHRDNAEWRATGTGDFTILSVTGSAADITSGRTISANQVYGDHEIQLSSVSGISVGDILRFSITVASPGVYTQNHLTRVLAINGTTLTLETEWPFSFTTSDTVAALVKLTPVSGARVLGKAAFSESAATGTVVGFVATYCVDCEFEEFRASGFPGAALSASHLYDCTTGRWVAADSGSAGAAALGLFYIGNCRIGPKRARDSNGFGTSVSWAHNSRFASNQSLYAGVPLTNGRGVKYEGLQNCHVDDQRGIGSYYNGVSLQKNCARNTFVRTVASNNGINGSDDGLALNGEHNVENVFLSVVARANGGNDIMLYGSSTEGDNAFLNVNEDAVVGLGNGARTRFQRVGSNDAVVDEDTYWHVSGSDTLTAKVGGDDRLVVAAGSVTAKGSSTGTLYAEATSGGGLAIMQASGGTSVEIGSAANVPVNLVVNNVTQAEIPANSYPTWHYGMNVAAGFGYRVGGFLAIDGGGSPRATNYNAASIANIAHAVNTANKAEGKMVWDIDNDRLMIALSATAGAAWKSWDDSTTVTPS